MNATEATVEDVYTVLTLPGRVAGSLIDNVSSALRPDHTISEQSTSYDSAGVVALVTVAGLVVAAALYVWGR